MKINRKKRIVAIALSLSLAVAMAPCMAFASTSTTSTTVAPNAPGTPTYLIGTAKSTSSISLKWEKARDAKGYAVYRASGSTYKRVKTTTSKSYTGIKLRAGTVYKYKVKAYREVNGKKIYGKYSSVVSVATKAKKGNTKSKLNVNKVSMNATSKTLKVGKTYTLKATIASPVKKSSVKRLVSKTLKWKTTNSKVAKVVNGKVTAVGYGTCRINAVAHNGRYKSCVINVIPEGYADQVLINGKIHTVNSTDRVVEAVAIKDGQFVYVGQKDSSVLKQITGKSTEVIDLKGATVIPGMFDAHSHPEMVAEDWAVNMPWTYDTDELLKFVKNYCEEHPDLKYFWGRYYPSELQDTMTAKLIDEYVADIPVRLEDFSDHSRCFNSKALEMMGIDKNSPDPTPPAEMKRDADGNPTGIFNEFEGYDEEKIFEATGWHPAETVDEEMWDYVVDYYHSVGIVGMGCAGISDEANIKAIYEMDKSGKLNMYYNAFVFTGGPDYIEDTIDTIKDYRAKYATDNITIDTVKYFVDGTNEIGTSWLVDGFEFDPSGNGEADCNEDEMYNMILRLNEEKLDLQLHLVGDATFRMVCNAVERAQKTVGGPLDIQVEMCHCELIHPDDMTRPAELGIIVNWTPHWTGGYFGDSAKYFVGEKRFNSMYDFQPMIKAGAIVNFGSDTVSKYEFHRSSPFFGMQTAITRVDPEYPLDEADYPGSMRPNESAKFTLDQLVRGYSINGAIQFKNDDVAGSIVPGKDANICVISEDLYNMDPFNMMNVEPKATMFKGKLTYGNL